MGRAVADLLCRAAPNDFATFAGVAVMLAVLAFAACYIPVLAFAACYIPVRRPLHVDPSSR
jgi:hypothetical protein